jgi:hypothetical protein
VVMVCFASQQPNVDSIKPDLVPGTNRVYKLTFAA